MPDKGRDHPPAPSRVATYARVSSTFQADAHGTDAQLGAVDAWLTANGIDPAAARRFEDLAVSGATMNRPGWGRLMRAVRTGEVDTIVLYDLSRAGRTLKGLVEWVDEMVSHKVRIVFVKDGIDVSSAMGRLVLHIMGAVAEFARQEMARRSSDGIRARLAKGEKWGAGRVIDPARRGCAKLTEEAWKAACARRRGGETIAAIAADIGLSTNHLGMLFRRAKVKPDR